MECPRPAYAVLTPTSWRLPTAREDGKRRCRSQRGSRRYLPSDYTPDGISHAHRADVALGRKEGDVVRAGRCSGMCGHRIIEGRALADLALGHCYGLVVWCRRWNDDGPTRSKP